MGDFQELPPATQTSGYRQNECECSRFENDVLYELLTACSTVLLGISVRDEIGTSWVEFLKFLTLLN